MVSVEYQGKLPEVCLGAQVSQTTPSGDFASAEFCIGPILPDLARCQAPKKG